MPRPLVGWQAPRSLETDLALHALESATWERGPELTRDHGHGGEPVEVRGLETRGFYVANVRQARRGTCLPVR